MIGAWEPSLTYRWILVDVYYETGRVLGVLPGFLRFHVSRNSGIPVNFKQHMDNGTGFFWGEKWLNFHAITRDHCEALVYRSYLLGCVSW